MNDKHLKEIKNEDKKAFKKYLIIMLIFAVIGAIFGATSGYLKENLKTVDASNLFTNIFLVVMPIISLILSILLVIVSTIVLKKSRQSIDQYNDKQDDDIIDKVEGNLSYIMTFTSINMIVGFLAFGTSATLINTSSEIYINNLTIPLIVIIVCLISTTMIQKRIVNIEKEINPFLKGSVYDTKFEKKWVESCDEAIKLCIYKSGYKAYKNTNFTCIMLWLLSFFGGFFFEFGIWPMIMVCIIWMVSIVSYCMESIKLSKAKN